MQLHWLHRLKAGAALLSLFLCMGMNTQVCQTFVALHTKPSDTHESAKELLESSIGAFQVGFNPGLRSRRPSRKESEVFGWSRIPK